MISCEQKEVFSIIIKLKVEHQNKAEGFDYEFHTHIDEQKTLDHDYAEVITPK